MDHCIGGEYVARVFDQVARFRGYPQAVRTDQGPESGVDASLRTVALPGQDAAGAGSPSETMPAQHVKAFVLRDETDALDAQAIWVAARQPHILPVPVKSERQQVCLALHGMRRQMMKMRIMQANALLGVLAEFGVTFPSGHKRFLETIHSGIANAQEQGRLAAWLLASIQEPLERIEGVALTIKWPYGHFMVYLSM